VVVLILMCIRLISAVNQYNERLSFKLNEDTGQDYCIFMRMPYRPEPDLSYSRVWS
jgi:hypothetical protein